MNDATLIAELGGPAKVAELLGYDKSAGGIQRVHNWRTRGIPPGVKLKHPEVFLKQLLHPSPGAPPASADAQCLPAPPP
jgi:hypothetical protein